VARRLHGCKYFGIAKFYTRRRRNVFRLDADQRISPPRQIIRGGELMNNGVIIWLVIFALSGASFFVIAAIVTVKGFADLQSLLRHSEREDKPNAKSEKER
jgi:hypothetical protein